MADPLAIVGCLLAITTIAAKSGRTLYKMAKEIEGAREDIEDFALSTSGFAAVTKFAHSSLEANLSVNSSTDVTQYIAAKGTIEYLTTQAAVTEKHIRRSSRKIETVESSIKFITRWRWMLRKEEIQAIRFEMESFKTSVLCVTLCIALEALQAKLREVIQVKQQEGQISKIQDEIKSIKEQLELQTDTLTVLTFSKQRQLSENQAYRQSDSMASKEAKTQRALINLGRSMETKGIVPNIETPSNASSSSGRRRHRQHSQINTPPQLPLRRTRASENLGGQSSNQAIKPPLLAQTALIKKVMDESDETDEIDVEESVSSFDTENQDNSKSISSISQYIVLETVYNPRALHGNVDTSFGRVHAQGIISPTLKESLISEDYAVSLGAQISYGQEETRTVRYNGETELSIGEVCLEWTDPEAGHLKTIQVRYWVFRNAPIEILLGKHFQKRRNQYKARHGG